MGSLRGHSNAGEDADVLVNEDENKYLDQIRHILKNGKRIDDRTGVGTISVFGMHSVYSLRNGKKFLHTKIKYIFAMERFV